MGFKIIDLQNILTVLEQQNKTINELSLVELGEQEFKVDNDQLTNPLIKTFVESNPREWSNKQMGRKGYYSKDYFKTICKDVVTIDIVSKCEGTFNLDLGLEFNVGTQFDIVTNLGTTEHVGQITDNSPNPQYYAFKNIHNLAKVGGLIFHNVPYGNMKKLQKHGAFNYDNNFFVEMANKLNYTIIYNRKVKRGNLIVVECCLQKNDDNFISEDEFNKIKGVYVTSLCKPKIKTFFMSL